LLAKLPESFRSQYVLAHTSKSEQFASAEQPRVIMFSPDAKLIIAFTGDENKDGGKLLEIIHFDDESGAFEFEEFAFRDKIKVSEKNPPRCESCHLNALRPNWSQYPNWPGFYGEDDNGIKADERKKLLALVSPGVLKSRYNFLAQFHHNYIEPSTDRGEAGRNRPKGSTNIRFGVELGRLNHLRIAKQIMGAKEYIKYKYFLAAVIINSDASAFNNFKPKRAKNCSLENFLPPTLLKSFSAAIRAYEENQKKSHRFTIENSKKTFSDDSLLFLNSMSQTFKIGFELSRENLTYDSNLENVRFNGFETGLNSFDKYLLIEGLIPQDGDLEFLKKYLRKEEYNNFSYAIEDFGTGEIYQDPKYLEAVEAACKSLSIKSLEALK